MTRDANDILREEGEDAVRALSDSATTQHVNGVDHEPLPAGPKPIVLIPFNELKLPDDPQYLVANILPRTGLVIIWGPPKSGKSFWLYDLLLHVALGWEYRGHEVEQGTIVYCYFEGQRAAAQRKEAFAQRHLREHGAHVPFYLMPVTLDLVTDHPRLIEAIKARGIKPVAVALDTLNRSFAGSESSDEDMTRYIAACDAIRDACNCVVPLVHHCGHDANRYRGHSSLGGAHDAMIAIRRTDENSPVVAEVEEMKDGQAGTKIASILEVVTVGQDRRGNPLTSCVVVPADMPTTARKRGRPKGSATQIEGLRALEVALDEMGTIPHGSNHAPQGPNSRWVSFENWRVYAVKRGLLDPSAKPWHQKQALRRIMTGLHAEMRVGCDNDFVWIIKE